MSSPTATIPKSHHITVNLNQVLATLQHAAEKTNYYQTYPARPFEYAPLTEPLRCQVSTLEELRDVLKPALTPPPPTYYKRWHNNQWVHILRYATAADETRHVLLYPTHIVVEETDTECIIDQSLAYYLGLALDPAAQFAAVSSEDAQMIGALRCFASGRSRCSNYDAFMPAVPNIYPHNSLLPPYSLWYDSFKYAFTGPYLAQKNVSPKLRLLYLERAANSALALARVVQNINGDNVTIAKPVSDLIQRFTPDLNARTKTESEDTYQSQGDLLKPAVSQFLETLFKTEAWQLSYRHFRNYFFNLGCQEKTDAENGIYRIDCSDYGRWFSARLPSHNQMAAAAPKTF
jgi:hypothetical protein